MAGNVSEWTDSSYDQMLMSISTMNPNVLINNVKVVRGGSWKDVAYFCK
jgi:formylglycine-generating enzyme required for sulfatase activity